MVCSHHRQGNTNNNFGIVFSNNRFFGRERVSLECLPGATFWICYRSDIRSITVETTNRRLQHFWHHPTQFFILIRSVVSIPQPGSVNDTYSNKNLKSTTNNTNLPHYLSSTTTTGTQDKTIENYQKSIPLTSRDIMFRGFQDVSILFRYLQRSLPSTQYQIQLYKVVSYSFHNSNHRHNQIIIN